jgi:hypothetical protein
MTTVININPNLFIDIEGAYITSSLDEATYTEKTISRSSVPFSQLRGGKFRRIFNRHAIAFRR